MKENPSTHERLAERLASIMTKLNAGARLSIKELALEYSVSTRTISRDFDRMSSNLPLLQDDQSKKFYLDPAYLTKVKPHDFKQFAQISGVEQLYPSLDLPFLKELLNQQASEVYSAKGYEYEDASLYVELFQSLSSAIQQHRQIGFLYKNEPKLVQPYRLIHHHGSWYLAAVRKGQLRTYRLSHMQLQTTKHEYETFLPDHAVLSSLEDEDSIWFGQDKFEVQIKVASNIASYFKQRRLLPEQQTLQELEDGALILSCQIAHTMQLLPLIRFWIPGLSILQPESLRQELKQSLMLYLQDQCA